jgi:hypothetical protein
MTPDQPRGFFIGNRGVVSVLSLLAAIVVGRRTGAGMPDTWKAETNWQAGSRPRTPDLLSCWPGTITGTGSAGIRTAFRCPRRP